ncbi:LysM peptidoglycan-binding domain-containing protein [Rossellomorea aquimaris]|uniref:LysM peptidoglycan-binding domain-containing protein n=1 Tax=Rossellomorea aquimaris TaxID=189382 RepID=UPI001CD4E360|nr:LysM peptidoglycan-binding domain-containing protein [Rossellomorea aquimaris]MCA1054678.1 LysM peptidoglycan-binding domain-containing protein [Rossellomorea aquimaris]
MNRDPFRDRAEKLKQKIERVQESPVPNKREPLPPRSELHREKKKKNKVKLKYPLISMLLLFFILMPLTVFSIYSYLDSRNEPLAVMSEEHNEVEEVQYDGTGEEDQSILTEENQEAVSSEEETDSSDDAEEDTPVTKKDGSSTKPTLPTAKAAEVEEPEGQTASATAGSEQGDAEGQKVIQHTVQPQETIFRIAMKYYHSQEGIDIIKKANNLTSNEIQSGQVLNIPLSEN